MLADSLVAPRSRVVNPVLKSALGVRESLCRAPELHALADVVSALLTPLALAARLTDLEGNLVSNFKVCLRLGAHRHNHARRLVTQRHWLFHDDVAIAVVVVVVQVRAAEAGCSHRDLELIGRRRSKVTVFLGSN